MRPVHTTPHPVRPGYSANYYGVICAMCYAPIPEWHPDPGMVAITDAYGGELGVTTPPSHPDPIRCRSCRP